MKFETSTSKGVESTDILGLSRKLTLNAELYLIEGGRRELLGFVSHKTLVFFAVEFTDYALQNYTKKNIPEAQACIDLTRKWIEDSSSVSNEELNAAANAANAAANAAAAAAYAAATAANAAANAAAAAAYAAANAANAAKKKVELERQGRFIIDFLRSDKALFLL